jgi:two-component system, chemotaxis family, response regulator Rcp1
MFQSSGIVQKQVQSLHSQRHILIVEDNPGDIRLMREALRQMDPPVAIHVAMDAEQALDYLTRKGEHFEAPRPHLIFLDFNLPKAGSRELLRTVKEDEELRLIPVAVLTTSDADRDIREAYELHANCYLRKPVDLDGFFNTIRSATDFWLKIAYIADVDQHLGHD